MGVLKRKDIRPREMGVILYNKDEMPPGEIDEETNTGGKGCSVRRYVKQITHHQKKQCVQDKITPLPKRKQVYCVSLL